MELAKSFKTDESGAVTVDWVVLTAGVVGLSMVMMMIVSGGVTNVSQGGSDNLNATTVSATP